METEGFSKDTTPSPRSYPFRFSRQEHHLRPGPRGALPRDLPPRRGHERRRHPGVRGEGHRPTLPGAGGLAVDVVFVPPRGGGAGHDGHLAGRTPRGAARDAGMYVCGDFLAFFFGGGEGVIGGCVERYRVK